MIVFWIRRKVPEPETWHAAREGARGHEPGIADLFAPGIRRITLLTMVVCACSLTAWWAFLFWNTQHLQNLEELKSWTPTDRVKLVTTSFFIVIGVSMAGNFFCGWLARLLGYRRSIAAMMSGFFLAMLGTFAWPHGHRELVHFWFPLVGFFSGVFGLFTMYLPPLFPVLLRTTGAGFCFNIGRIAAAFGTVYFGLFAKVGDFSRALLYAGCLFPLAAIVALLLPEPRDESAAAEPET
jgi:MFS family permease